MNEIDKLKYIVDRFKAIEKSIDEIKIEIMDFFIECEHVYQISERRAEEQREKHKFQQLHEKISLDRLRERE